MVTSHHHLGVYDEVDREDDGADSSVDNLEDSVVWDEDHQEAANDEDKKYAKHGTPTGSEVYFGLEMRFSLDDTDLQRCRVRPERQKL